MAFNFTAFIPIVALISDAFLRFSAVFHNRYVLPGTDLDDPTTVLSTDTLITASFSKRSLGNLYAVTTATTTGFDYCICVSRPIRPFSLSYVWPTAADENLVHAKTHRGNHGRMSTTSSYSSSALMI
ncbi:uncharacterized protein LOC118749146 [Rhagoletis pomonella]|uniref:uncharacterized protein LOC118749146 n=1 Tax=Rhagoletis pomonella TaxID=28610 RepID=UPI00177AAB3F|nr:uncharacterized protein LOC118749146 [Rhagoletis pomonella]